MNKSYVTIPGVEYGAVGAFTIVLWARFGLMTGNSMAYIFSHNASEDTQAALDPNQVRKIKTSSHLRTVNSNVTVIQSMRT